MKKPSKIKTLKPKPFSNKTASNIWVQSKIKSKFSTLQKVSFTDPSLTKRTLETETPALSKAQNKCDKTFQTSRIVLMSIVISNSNTCSLEDGREISRLGGDMVLQVLRMLIVKIVRSISKSSWRTRDFNNLRRTFLIELDLKVSKFPLFYLIFLFYFQI